MMSKYELVFVPLPAMGHLVPAVEFAKLVVGRDERFSITLLIIKAPFMPSPVTHYIHSVSASFFGPIRFLHLPPPDPSPPSSPSSFLHNLMESQKPLVRDAVRQLILSQPGSRLAGIVLDMWFTSMMDVADELGVPSYVFYTSSAASLSIRLHLQALHDHQGVGFAEFAGSDESELVFPGLANSIPARVLLAWVEREGGGFTGLLDNARKLREAKGIIVNTFMELESRAIESMAADDGTPPVYPVGPLLNSNHGDQHNNKDYWGVMKWLDDQPPSSVVFLCFGGVGGFREDQTKNIASGIDKSGYRFLWTLRRPPPKGKIQDSGDYSDPSEVLPAGFLDRTSEIGKIISWAPQTDVLAHPAIGGFVSHCGWNSTLESMWNGVPMATWPIHAEQPLNAFLIVKELKIGVEIRLDYKKDTRDDVITADEMESRMTSLMSGDIEMRERRMRIRDESTKALSMEEGGASFSCCLQRLIGDIITHSSLRSAPREKNTEMMC